MEEIKDAEARLRDYATTKMPRHRAFTQRINEIYYYLQGRKQGLCKR